jgi:hypothetical protein
MPKAPLPPIATLGIDMAKNSFHLIGLDTRGAIVLRQKLSRGQVEARLANMPTCLISMEACVGAHHLSRQLLVLLWKDGEHSYSPGGSPCPSHALRKSFRMRPCGLL